MRFYLEILPAMELRVAFFADPSGNIIEIVQALSD
jgi:hypothetical protein